MSTPFLTQEPVFPAHAELALAAAIIAESLSTLSCLPRMKLLEPGLVSFMLPWFGGGMHVS